AISNKRLRQLDGHILPADEQEQFVDTLHRFRYRDRIIQVAECDLYCVRKRTRLAPLAGQSAYVRATLSKRLDYLSAYPARCAYYKNLHCFFLLRHFAAP